MKIELDKEKKLILIQALQQGYIESEILTEWNSPHNMPIEEIDRELERLTRILHPDDCNRIKRLGLCEYCKNKK